MRELQFEELITLRDLINKYPEVLDMPMAVIARDDLYEFIGEANAEGNMGKVFIKNYSFSESPDEVSEPIPVLVFAPNNKYCHWE